MERMEARRTEDRRTVAIEQLEQCGRPELGGRVHKAYDGAFYSLVQNRRTPTGRKAKTAHDGALRPNSDGGGAGIVAATTAQRLSRTAVEWTNGVGHGELPVDGEGKF